jgi:hypothetical protein
MMVIQSFENQRIIIMALMIAQMLKRPDMIALMMIMVYFSGDKVDDKMKQELCRSYASLSLFKMSDQGPVCATRLVGKLGSIMLSPSRLHKKMSLKLVPRWSSCATANSAAVFLAILACQ